MRYRIKDSEMREAAFTLFGDLAIEFEGNPRFIELELKPEGVIAHPLTARIELEPVRELVDGWNPYPQVKPTQQDTLYMCAVHANGQDLIWSCRYRNGFGNWNADVFAWQELPKIWKDL